MRLLEISYSEFEDHPQEWVLVNLELGKKNLLVGKNASGKTRILNIISGLSKIITGKIGLFNSGTYRCKFKNNGSIVKYSLSCKDKNISHEHLEIDNEVFLTRKEDGTGKIFNTQQNGLVAFQTPPSLLAVFARRDTIQHSFLEQIYEWASTVRHFEFSKSAGKDILHIQSQTSSDLDDSDSNAVLRILMKGMEEFPDTFHSTLLNDFNSLNYNVESIHLQRPITIQDIPIAGTPIAIAVKERNLAGPTDQFSMSQGMFRVLSLLIHINYFNLKYSSACLLIDDIGEGLDFERSCTTIDLLRAKADRGDIQLIMSTNDRFVMNNVPLEEWSVIQRNGCKVSTKNYSNSKDIFEEFKFTGLGNFSFFELDMINAPLSNEEDSHA